MATTDLNAATMLKRENTRNLTPDPSGGYVATIHEFPGCVAHGNTADEAISNLEAAAEAWLDAALGTGYPVPEPANYSQSSGKIALRISRRLHKLAAERAAREGTSLNQLLCSAVDEYLSKRNACEYVLAELKTELRTALSHSALHASNVFAITNKIGTEMPSRGIHIVFDSSAHSSDANYFFLDQAWPKSPAGAGTRRSSASGFLIRTKLGAPEELSSSKEVFVASSFNDL